MVPPTAPMLRQPTLALAAWLAGAAQVASALRVPSSRSRAPTVAMGLGNRVYQEASSPQSTPERFRGKGTRSPPRGASPQSSAQTWGRLASRDKVCNPLRLDFHVGVGGSRMLLEGLKPPYKEGARGSEQTSAPRYPAQARTRCTMGCKGSSVLARTPRSCRRGPRDFLSGQRAQPCLGPPTSPLPARRLVGRCIQQPTLSAKSARRVGDAGGWGKTGLCFYFSKSLYFTAKFPGRRLSPGIGASHRRSFPSPHVAPESPASWS